ncbi:MAG: single-stranded-DNA-specific exonuclease RecJ [Planctomycetota bacterium]|nr:MAG: single-stranded-DNA-specific exonuclease RecJ [Planctomycetota bacterium]
MIQKSWRIKNPTKQKIDQIKSVTNLSLISSTLLSNLNINETNEIKSFVKPDLDTIHSPMLFKNMDKALQRIEQALNNQEKICCYGDYDVDGITGSSLLYNFFDFIGGNARHYIPDRIKEGYGLNKFAIEKVYNEGCKLLITADCGIRSIEEVDFAKSIGLDIIITDHHEQGELLPNACAIINPKLHECNYPFKGISGSGVALKLAWAIAEGLNKHLKIKQAFSDFLIDSLSFATLGTIADMVPLLDENRVIVKFGLESIRQSSNVGIQALLEVSVDNDTPITTETVAFQIAPRINAAGRLGRSDLISELFTTKSRQKALELARELNELNISRREIELEYSKEAFLQAEEIVKKYSHTIVLDGDDWHSGIIGIIASRILDKYYRPTFIISHHGEDKTIGKGSARSIEGYSLPSALEFAKDHLVQFGGHDMAAGFVIKRDRVQAFRDAIETDGKSKLNKELLVPILRVDIEIDLDSLNMDLLEDIDRLAPFGCANPNPMFATKNVNVIGSPRVIGKKKTHLKFKIVKNGTVCNVIAFNFAERLNELLSYQMIDVAFVPYLEKWNGRKSVDLRLKDFREAK